MRGKWSCMRAKRVAPIGAPDFARTSIQATLAPPSVCPPRPAERRPPLFSAIFPTLAFMALALGMIWREEKR